MKKQIDIPLLDSEGHFDTERAIEAGRDTRTEALRVFFYQLTHTNAR